jgi:hypothetical protein
VSLKDSRGRSGSATSQRHLARQAVPRGPLPRTETASMQRGPSRQHVVRSHRAVGSSPCTRSNVTSRPFAYDTLCV